MALNILLPTRRHRSGNRELADNRNACRNQPVMLGPIATKVPKLFCPRNQISPRKRLRTESVMPFLVKASRPLSAFEHVTGDGN